MVMQARKLDLPQPRSRRSSEIASALLDPHSRSLALMFADSSLLLYPSLYPLFPTPSSPSSPPLPPPTPVPPTATSSAFLLLQPTPASPPRVLFLTAGPLRTSVLLRAWILSTARTFTRAHLSCSKNQIAGDQHSVLLPLRHGFSVSLAGSVNVFLLHSPSEQQIWVFAVRLVDGEKVNLVKCASIACTAPIYAMRVSMGVLLLGEQNGVRVFPLRLLVKGQPAKKKSVFALNIDSSKQLRQKNLNGENRMTDSEFGASSVYANDGANCSNGKIDRFAKGEVDTVPAKHKIVRLRQDSGDMGSFFIALKCLEAQISECKAPDLSLPKAVSIHSLSLHKFLILDSVGDVHILSLHKYGSGVEVNGQTSKPSRSGQIRRLECSMKAQMLAAYPDSSSRTQTVWVSDGSYSIHVLTLTDPDFPTTSKNKEESAEKLMQISAIQAIFSSEKIQDIISYDPHCVIVLCQAIGSISAYSTSGS